MFPDFGEVQNDTRNILLVHYQDAYLTKLFYALVRIPRLSVAQGETGILAAKFVNSVWRLRIRLRV